MADHLWKVADRDADFALAEKLARSILEWETSACKHIDMSALHRLNRQDQQKVRFMAIATSRLADTLRESQNSDCVNLNYEALRLYRAIDDPVDAAIRLFNMGHVFKNVRSVRDLSKSAQYYKEAYDAYPDYDQLAKAQCLGQLAAVSLELMREAFASGAPQPVALKHLNAAIENYEMALELTPIDADVSLAQTHNQLGVAYLHSKTEHLKSLEHFKKATYYFDMAEEWLASAGSRINAAQILEMLARPDEAREYAAEAERLYEAVGYKGAELAQAKRMLGRTG